MAKEPDKKQKQPAPYMSKDGPIPPDHFDDDLPCDPDFKPQPGGAYDYLTERDKKNKSPK